MKLVLDAIEDKVRSLLLQYSREFAKNGNPEVTLRFTGGWVRDKLLGRPSHDIDVAIDKSTGEEFAAGLHNYMVDQGIDETGVHKIAVNPEKSKHLETATTRICGLDIDFVNLRSEEYANASSRVPSAIRFGTPQEDAFRRDATLNALFYNLTTELVEDFTGRGLSDLKQGVLRTPLSPAETFADDPLRVLRILRFAGQLGFSIDPETFEAMQGSQVGEKLLTKVSSERMGIELWKMLQSKYAASGVKYLIDLGLAPYVFKVPNSEVHGSTEQLRSSFQSLMEAQKAAPSSVPEDSGDQGILWLAVLLQDIHFRDTSKNYASEVVQNGLKLTRQAKDGCVKLLQSADSFDELRAAASNAEVSRSELGNFVRRYGKLWSLCLAFNASRLAAADEDIQIACQLETLVRAKGLENAYQMKPILDGKQVMALAGKKPGPWLQPMLKKVVDFQLDHPEASTEDAEHFVLDQLRI